MLRLLPAQRSRIVELWPAARGAVHDHHDHLPSLTALYSQWRVSGNKLPSDTPR